MGVKALHRSMLAHMHVAAKTMAAVAAGILVVTIDEESRWMGAVKSE